MKNPKRIVAVIPCYNEGESLSYTIAALIDVRKKLLPKYELDVMFINDGSKDDTQAVIEAAAKAHDFVFYRQFSRNAGHQAALRAGLNAAVDYDATVMLDADMQHPPQLIPDMIAKWEEGYKVVQMLRSDDKQKPGFFKYMLSRSFYVVINTISDLKLEYGSSDFRLADRSVVETVAQSREHDLFLRGYFTWLPASRTSIKYNPNERVAGVPKYTLKKSLDLASKGILQFSEKPLRMAMGLGIFFAVTSFLYGLILTLLYITGGVHAVSGWTSLMVVLLFCFGVNFILLGIIGSYLAHSISIQKERPEYVIATQKLRELSR